MRIRILTCALAALVCLSSQALCAGAEELARGKVIERVVCQGDQNQTYALYLPSSYSTDRKWPIIFAFDPGARGAVPVRRFEDAAEKYGYIIAASNNSRNGAREATQQAIVAMFNDASARFPIDERRVYVAGFSGGARVATNVALLYKGRIAGVMACGAGYPAEMRPAAGTPFVFFGTVGTDDFNYTEMRTLERTLGGLGVTNRLEVFDGGHEWASPELCMLALEWFELQAIKSGGRAKDEALVDALMKKDIQRAKEHEAAGRLLRAAAAYDWIARDYKGLKDVAEFEKKAAELKDSKEVRQALKLERDQETDEQVRIRELFNLRSRIESAPRIADEEHTREQAIADLRRAIADLRKKAEAKEPSPERSFARRTLNQYLAAWSERSMILMLNKKYDQAIANLQIDAESMPDNPRVLYNLACAYSGAGDKKRALDALGKAVQKGFANTAELQNNKALDGLRDEPGFKKIIEELARKAS